MAEDQATPWDASPLCMVTALRREAREGPIARRLNPRLRWVGLLAIALVIVCIASTRVWPRLQSAVPSSAWWFLGLVCAVVSGSAYSRFALRVAHLESIDLRLLPIEPSRRLLGMLAPYAKWFGTVLLVPWLYNALWTCVRISFEPARVVAYDRASLGDLRSIAALSGTACTALLLTVWLVGVGSCLWGWGRAASGRSPFSRVLYDLLLTPITLSVTIMLILVEAGPASDRALRTLIVRPPLGGVVLRSYAFYISELLTALICFATGSLLLRWRWRKDFAVACENLFVADAK